METYTWKREQDSVEFTFKISIGERLDRFDKEGILEYVQFYLGKYLLDDTTFGREHMLNSLVKLDKNSFLNLILDGNCFINDWTDEDMINLKCWLTNVLTPIEEQRKVKIDKITSKINATV
jgi:hypothetical protein